MSPIPPATTGGRRVALLPRRLQHNPYPELLASALERGGVEVVEAQDSFRWYWQNRGRVDAIHLNWLHAHYRHWRGGAANLVAAAGFVLRMLFARALGYRLFWTVHNERPHDSSQPWLDRIMRVFVLGLARPVVHCPYAARMLHDEFGPGTDAVIIPHGNFRSIHAVREPAADARAELGLSDDERIVLFVGQLRPYKGVDELLDVWPELRRRRPTARLHIAGLVDDRDRVWWGRMRGRLEGLGDQGLVWSEGFVDDEELPTLFAAAHVLALPYRRILTSGSAILAWGLGRAVVAPRMGCFQDDFEDPALRLYASGSYDGLIGALERALDTPPERAESAAHTRASALAWEQSALLLARAYSEGEM